MIKFVPSMEPFTEQMKLLFKVWDKWPEWSATERVEFVAYRKSILNLTNNDWEDCESSGTTGYPKKYRWGPYCADTRRFYRALFFDYSEYIRLSMFQKEAVGYVLDPKEHLSLTFWDKPPKNQGHKLKHLHITTNPEALYIFLKKYGSDFLYDFVDVKSCVFCFTGSSLTQEHRLIFNSVGIDKIKNYMRCWDGGATFYTCPFYNTHWIDMSAEIRVEEGKLISTDLWNSAQKFVDYPVGDLIEWRRWERCACGLEIDQIEFRHNPRCFEVNGCYFNYDHFYYQMSELVVLDFLYITVFDNKIVLNMCGVINEELEKYVSKLRSNYRDVEFELRECTIPECGWKYKRINVCQ